MDISVSRLNGRLASKLPPELPLGLVFVVGEVLQLHDEGFVLAEGEHWLSCHLAGEQSAVAVGNEVRASGHLMFDSQRLQYYLLARDIEVVEDESAVPVSREMLAQNEDLLSALAAVKARAAVAPEVDGAAMPLWVKKLVPPELKPEESEDHPQLTEHRSLIHDEALDSELVTMLSAAMDSEEEMEITPELLAPYISEEQTEEISSTDDSSGLEDGGAKNDAGMGEETAESLAGLTTSYRPASRQDTDWLVILLIISFFVLTVAVFITVILLIVQ